VRNALIGKLDLLPIRSDKGQLWENFLMSERYKQHDYRHTYQRMYFWRTKQQQEIDLIEEGDGRLQAFEFKWSTQKKARFPLTFTRNYDSATILVNRENFREFLKS
jgi:predicted AAA+ superfamily ATPase